MVTPDELQTIKEALAILQRVTIKPKKERPETQTEIRNRIRNLIR